MKRNVSWFASLFLFGVATAAVANHECISSDGKYQVMLDTQHTSGVVYEDGREARFGQLVCDDDGESLDCRSRGVADAGFWITFDRGGYTAKLYEESFAGANFLADLTCTK